MGVRRGVKPFFIFSEIPFKTLCEDEDIKYKAHLKAIKLI